MVCEPHTGGLAILHQMQSPCNNVDLCTPPKVAMHSVPDLASTEEHSGDKKELDHGHEQDGATNICKGDEGFIGHWTSNNNQTSRRAKLFEG